MKQYISEILIGIIVVFVCILFIFWFFGFFIGFNPNLNCHTGRIIADNWVTGLGYQLSCKR